jgi:hypothetical protein
MTHEANEEDSVDTYCKKENLSYTYVDTRKDLISSIDKFKKISPEFLISVNYR